MARGGAADGALTHGRARTARRPNGQCARWVVAEAGQAVVEAAVAFPLLLMLAIALVQFALFTHAQHVVTAAVQDGARVAAHDGQTVRDGVEYAQSLLEAGLGRTAADVSLNGADGSDVVVLEARGRLSMIIPWVGDGSLPLQARAIVSKERFRPGGSG